MSQTITYTFQQEDIPAVLRQKALKEGKPLAEILKEGALLLAKQLTQAAEKTPAHRRPSESGQRSTAA